VTPGASTMNSVQASPARSRGFVDPRTGRPVVKEVSRADQRFQGPASLGRPDLFVSWAKEAPRDALYSSQVGTITGPPTDLRSGNHRAEGFATLYGLGAPAGQRVDSSLLEVVPTILDCFGLPVPPELDR
jgi:hypothetical protein